MPVNPYSTPSRLEYKPLGLETFAKPFSEMRQQFETAQDKIDQTEFELSRLAKDDERAKEMLKEVEAARDELAQNLVNTGNYREATQKLLRMNKQFNKGEETSAIKSNYDTYQKALEEQKERVKSGKISNRDLEIWKFNTAQDFKGTNYDPKTGEYTPINVTPFSDNLEKEIEEKSLELARMTVADKTIAYQQLIKEGIPDAYAQDILKVTTESKPLDRIKEEIAGYLKSSGRYKEYVDSRANAEFKYNNYKDPEFGQNYINGLLSENEQKITAFQNALANPNLTSAQKEDYTKGLKTWQKAQQDIQTNLSTIQDQEGLNEYAQKLYLADKQGIFKNLATRAGDLVDYTNISQDIIHQNDEAKQKKHEEVAKKVKEVGAITMNVTATQGDAKTIVGSGQATSTESALINNKKNAYEMIKAIPVDKTPGLENIPTTLTAAQLGGEDNKKEFDSLLSTSRDLFVVQNRMWQMNRTDEKIDAEIKSKKDELQKASNQDVKDGLTEELNQLYLDKQELRIARTDDTKTLDLIIENTIKDAPKEVKDLYDKTYKKDAYSFLETLRTAVNNHAKRVTVQKAQSDQLQEELNNNPALVRDQLGELQIVVPKIEDPTGNTLKAKDPLTSFAMKVMDSYVENIKSSYLTLGVEVTIDEKANAITDDAFKRTIEYAKSNQRGSSEVKKVSFNNFTGETKEDSKGNNYNLAFYEETPHYAGVDQNGSVILRYVRKPGIKQNEIATAVKTELNIPTVQGAPFVLSDAQKNNWEADNPENLYVTVKGRTPEIINNAEKNYRDMMDYGLEIGGEEGFGVVQQTIQNFAAIHVLSDPKRRELYFEMAARLKDAADKGHKYTNLTQAPAAYTKNQDGSYTGFVINYQLDNGNVIGIVEKQTMNPDRTFTITPFKTVNLGENSSNLTTALAAMDLMYGTGREEDTVENNSGETFVPAFRRKGNFGTATNLPKGF